MQKLFIVNTFLHKQGPNGICVTKVVDELNRRGIKSSVVTQRHEKHTPNIEKYDNCEVYNVNKAWRWRDYGNETISKLKVFSKRIFNLLLLNRWPLREIFLKKRYYKTACKIYKKEPFDTVVAVYNGIDELAAGMMVKKKYPDVRFIIYTLDALSGREIPKRRESFSKIYKKSIQKWEHKVYEAADYICIMKSHEGHHLEKKYDVYRKKFVIMDIPLLDYNSLMCGESNIKKQDNNSTNIKIVYTGSMRSYAGNPKYLIKLMEVVKNVELHIYGTIESDIEKVLSESELFGKRILFHGAIENSAIKSIQRNADILLTLGCTNPNMVPCKIFEYLSICKPILNLYRIDQDSAYPYLLKYPLTLQIFEDENLIEENAEKLKHFIFEINNKNVDSKIVFNEFLENTPIPMANFIEKSEGA